MTTQVPKSRGRIVCLKTFDDDDDNSRTSMTACEIARAMGISPSRVFASDIFNGFSIKGDISEECIQKLREADIFVDVAEDFEAHAIMETNKDTNEHKTDKTEDRIQSQVQSLSFQNKEQRPWWTERIGLFKSRSAAIGESEEDNGDPKKDPKRYIGEDVDVFVLDTGVEKSHPYLNVVETRSFICEEPETNDLQGHGTQCAGIIGAYDRGWKKDEYVDVVGIAPNVRIHGFKVLGKDGSGSFSDIISAVEEIAKFKRENPDKRVVVNMSLGGFVGTPFYTALDREIARLVERRGVTVLVAAGNDNEDALLHSPSHTKEAITVGCYDQHDNFSRFSNFGKDVDILAPGNDIRTSTINAGVDSVTGTSFACPMVCGAAALILGKNKTKILTPHQVLG